MSPHIKIKNIVFPVVLAVFSLAGFSSASATTYTASLSTSGAINLDVAASGNGANVTTDNVTVISTCPLGYTLSISGPSDSTLYKNGDNTSTSKIDASSGTKSSPVSLLGENINTWGFTTGSSITASSNFIGLTNNLTELTTSVAASAAGGDVIPVYYGASVDTDIEAGLYTMAESTTGAGDNVITYFLTTSLDCTSYQVAFNPTSTATGSALSGTGTMDNQRIAEGVSTNLDANSYTAPNGYYFGGWNTAQDGTGTTYADGAAVTDLTTAGNIVTLYARWTECLPGSICYSDNGANSLTTMGNQSVASNATNVTLWASNFKRTNYGFAGWNTKADGTGTNYGPNETIDDATILSTIQTDGLKLYAKWVASAGNLQGWTGCASLASGAVTALKDTRDNDVYAVAKLADGKCWMIENLRLDYDASHNSDGTLAQGYGGQFAGLAQPETTNFSSNTTANSLYYINSQVGTATISIGTTNASFRMPRYNNNNTNSSVMVSNMTDPDQNVYSYGNYYTWSAAVADTTNYSTTNVSLNTSICPSGWELPAGGNKSNEANNDYWSLIVNGINNGTNPANYSSNTTPYYTSTQNDGLQASRLVRKYPNNFVYSGIIVTETANNGERGMNGHYWTSTVKGSSMSYSTRIGAGLVYPGNYYDADVVTVRNVAKYNGRSVRCVASNVEAPVSIDSLEYFQDFDSLSSSQKSAVLNSMTTGTAYALTDSRDGTNYKVAKLADGKIWMLDNLALDITDSSVQANLDSSTTNASNTALNSLINGGGSSPYCQTAVVKTSNSIAWQNGSAKIVDDYKNTVATHYGSGSGKRGIYYNHWAVSAGSYCLGTSSATELLEDICPAGWKLPTSSGDYQTLSSSYNNYTNLRNAFSVTMSGEFETGAYSNVGTYGEYWTSSIASGDDRYTARFTSSAFSIRQEGFHMGYPTRCVAK